MQTVPGSEKGVMAPTEYMTEEIKQCPECDLQVREHYEATWILPTVQIGPPGQRKRKN